VLLGRCTFPSVINNLIRWSEPMTYLQSLDIQSPALLTT
jgi:hypothetical protein